MVTASEYLKRAQECRNNAVGALSEKEKAKWLAMASDWTQLANSGVDTPANDLEPPKA